MNETYTNAPKPDLADPEARDFWKSVYLSAIPHEPHAIAVKIADAAVADLLARVG